jgi:hypothetical protein
MSAPAPEPAPTYVIEAHLAAGDGWVLSRGRLTAVGEPVLLGFEDTEDLVALRRRLAIAGSVGGRHLAAVRDVQAIDAAHAVVAVSPPGGPSLAQLTAARGSLAAGEVVTLVVPLAATIATLHARGVALSDVTAATVWVADDGRPVLLPVGCRDAAGGPTTGGAGRGVAALAGMALAVLDRSSAGGTALAAALEAAIGGGLDAAGFATVLLRCAQPTPIVGAVGDPRPLPRHRASRRPRLGPLLVVAVVVGVAVALGGLWGRHDGSDVFAAPPVHVWPVAAGPMPTSTAAPSWRLVITALENTRARAYATGDAALLGTVYADGSPTGRSDLDLLRGLVLHGQHAAGLRAFVERVTVVTATASRTTLDVADALTAYDVVAADGHVQRRGHGRPTREWMITLVRTVAGWRIWSVAPL